LFFWQKTNKKTSTTVSHLILTFIPSSEKVPPFSSAPEEMEGHNFFLSQGSRCKFSKDGKT
jgi:hypothetical protein